MRTVTQLPAVPPRPFAAHKGTFGTVVVVGGCQTMIGAPALCAHAALRSGAGLVKVAVPDSILQTVIGIEPGATGIALSEDAESAVVLLDEADPRERAVLAVGTGWGMHESRFAMMKWILSGPRTVVLDADGLNVLAQSGPARPVPGPPLILTPHPGEFRRLAESLGIDESPADLDARCSAAARLAEAHGAVVVLKGHRSIVCDGRQYFVNQTGNPALATAGSGDILTGAISALCAQGMEPFNAAMLGVHLHGLAADLWSAENGLSGLTAFDLAERLPTAFRQHRLK